MYFVTMVTKRSYWTVFSTRFPIHEYDCLYIIIRMSYQQQHHHHHQLFILLFLFILLHLHHHYLHHHHQHHTHSPYLLSIRADPFR